MKNKLLTSLAVVSIMATNVLAGTPLIIKPTVKKAENKPVKKAKMEVPINHITTTNEYGQLIKVPVYEAKKGKPTGTLKVSKPVTSSNGQMSVIFGISYDK